MLKQHQKRRQQKPASKMQSRFDELGSYTGVNSVDRYEKPTQDADDL